MQPNLYHVELGLPEGKPTRDAQLTFAQKAVRINSARGIADLDLHKLDGIVIALDWVADNRHHIWGSAVMVGPGIAITARHVIDEMIAHGLLKDSGGQIFATSLHADRVELWRADSYTRVDVGDLSLLTLIRTTAQPERPVEEPANFSLATMAARMPIVGENITLIGFKAAELSYSATAPLSLALVGSTGPVTDLYPQRRDAHNLPNPSFGVAACTVNGMSGGAAFDSNGRLIGVISSGVEDEHSFVSLTWPATYVPITPTWWPLMQLKSPTSLGALAKAGIFRIEHLDDVDTWQTDDGHLMASISDPNSVTR